MSERVEGKPLVTVRDLIDIRAVGGTRVAVFDSHNLALIPWADFAREVGKPVRLLTLDFHTDTMVAFRGYLSRQRATWQEGFDLEASVQKRIAQVDLNDDRSLQLAAAELKHDEHIDAAIRLGIIETAFVICSDRFNSGIESNEQIALEEATRTKYLFNGEEIWMPGTGVAEPPFTYTLPENRMVILPERNVYSWSVKTTAEADVTVSDGASADADKEHVDEADEGDDDDAVYEDIEEDDDHRADRDAVLESEYLEERLQFVEDVCRSTGIPSMFDEPFILDIDLDYFNTRRGACPTDSAVFKDLVRRAGLITIAREPGCVVSCQLEGEGLTADWLEAQVMAIAADALREPDKHPGH